MSAVAPGGVYGPWTVLSTYEMHASDGTWTVAHVVCTCGHEQDIQADVITAWSSLRGRCEPRPRKKDGCLVHHLVSVYPEDLQAAARALYGEACACCGTVESLAVDHVYGGGPRHLREMFGGYSDAFYRWLLDNHPAGFQVLCQRCNSSKGSREACQFDHAAWERLAASAIASLLGVSRQTIYRALEPDAVATAPTEREAAAK